MPSDVETQLRTLGRLLERDVAHVDVDEIVELETTTPIESNGRRPRSHHLVAAVAAAAILAVLVAVLRPHDHGQPQPPAATTTTWWPTSPYPAHGVRPLFPEAGPLAVGEHRWIPKPTTPTPILSFTVPTPGWRSGGYKTAPNGGGWIEKGTPGKPDGAVITFWRPDRVATDPCGHTLVTPRLRPWPMDLAGAVAAIPGIELVSGPTERPPVSQDFSDQEVVLRIPEDIDCDPQEFYLWADGDHPRTATARGSTITISIVAGSAGPFFVEAETYKGASPELEREVQQIVDSLRGGGGIG